MAVTSFAIVAIPSQDDYVWRISSEKVPHLTLLYMDANLEDVNRAAEFIGHVANTSLNKFMLDVDHRGVLGAESADVLFFNNYGIKRLAQFRSYLLNDDDIFKAYSSVKQYPSWTPHLTLGYPATPAKPDNRENPGVHWVDFDRIALWTGDYEGVEFQLKSPGSDIDMAMSDNSRRGELFLEHSGVKGMRWGVIRDKIKENPVVKYASPSSDHTAVQKTRLKAQVVGVRTLSNKDLQHLIKRVDLEVKYKDLKAVKHKQSLLGKGAAWVGRAATNILVGTAISWLGRGGIPDLRKARPHPGPANYPSWVGRPGAIPTRKPLKPLGAPPVRRAIGSG